MYAIIDSSSALDSIHQHLGTGSIIQLDTETVGLDPHSGKLRLVQMNIDNKVFIVDAFKFSKEQLAEKLAFLSDPSFKILAHNAAYEYKWLLHHLGIRLGTLYDTYIADVLCDFDRPEHGLKAVAKHWLDVDLPKDQQTSDWSGVLSAEQFAYAYRDVIHLLPIRIKQIEKLKQTGQIGAAKLEFDTIPAIAEMELNGMAIDKVAYQDLIRHLEQERDKKARALSEWIVSEGGKKDYYERVVQEDLFGDTIEIETSASVNLNSVPQIKKKFQALGINIETTDKKELGYLSLKHPELRLLIDYREAQKSASSYGQKFLDENVNPVTGRIHCSLFQLGAKTTRLAARNPNLMNQPNSKQFRQVYAVPEGRRLDIADFSQVELRIWAEFSGDPLLLETYEKGLDIHSMTASKVFGLPYEGLAENFPKERKGAKETNFATLYGISPPALTLRLANKGVVVTEDYAEKLIEGFYATYPQGAEWLYRQEAEVLRNPFVRTIGGHLITVDFDRNDRSSVNSAKRLVRNFPIQGGSAVITKTALIELQRRLMKDYPTAKIVNVVHDEILVEADEGNAEEVLEVLVSSMENAGSKYMKKIKIEASGAVGKNWADKV